MRLHDIAWSDVADEMDGWRALDVFTRRAMLDHARPDQTLPLRALSGHLGAIRSAGWLDRRHDEPVVLERRRPLLWLLRLLRNADPFAEPRGSHMTRYLARHFDQDEQEQLAAAVGTATPDALARQVAAPAWRGLFDERGAAATLDLPLVDPDLDALLDWLDQQGGIVPLTRLGDAETDLDLSREQIDAALETGLRLVLVRAGLRNRDLEPLVGAAPKGVARATSRRKAPAAPPEPTTPVEIHDAGWGLHDLLSVLGASTAEPPRLRASGDGLYRRDVSRLGNALAPLPDWLTKALGLTAEHRLEAALLTLRRLGFLTPASRTSGFVLETTEAGAAWAQVDERTRVRDVLDALRDDQNRIARDPGGVDGTPRGVPFVPRELDLFLVDEGQLQTEVVKPFEAFDEDVFLSLESFLAYRADRANPLGTWASVRMRSYASWGFPRLGETEVRERWKRQLRRFVVDRLLAFGGARAGRLDDGVAFGITGLGRYLLGRDDTFALPPLPPPCVVVQPNFDVVFLAPAVRHEAAIARFAERLGQGVGTLFRLTRDSVLQAAASGIDAEQALAALDAACSQPVPPTVARQLREWLAACRRAELRTLTVLDCPDRETAHRVLAAGGKHVRLLGETIVEVRSDKQRPGLLRKLRSLGIFVDG